MDVTIQCLYFGPKHIMTGRKLRIFVIINGRGKGKVHLTLTAKELVIQITMVLFHIMNKSVIR
jgi:hypothetical protein